MGGRSKYKNIFSRVVHATRRVRPFSALATVYNVDDHSVHDNKAMSTIAQPVAGYFGQLLTFLQGFSTVQLVILALVNIPLFAIAINVLLQLVRIPIFLEGSQCL